MSERDAVVTTLALAGRPVDCAYVERWCDIWDMRLERLRAEVVTDR